MWRESGEERLRVCERSLEREKPRVFGVWCLCGGGASVFVGVLCTLLPSELGARESLLEFGMAFHPNQLPSKQATKFVLTLPLCTAHPPWWACVDTAIRANLPATRVSKISGRHSRATLYAYLHFAALPRLPARCGSRKDRSSTTCLSSNNADAPPTNHHRVKTPSSYPCPSYSSIFLAFPNNLFHKNI